jgi:cyclophilin family peptidyl-prolyl cis-trans isomerase
MKKTTNKLVTSLIALSALSIANIAQATIVEFQTSQGTFEINLYDQTTPETVTNFLKYVDQGLYNNTVIHRAIPEFIIQGGGSTFDNTLPLTPIENFGAISNEPVWSNVQGTIAMAKVGGNVNSATNQWFFNLENNSSNLDLQNGGFTAFGQVSDSGLEILKTISQLDKCRESTAHPTADFPVDNFTCSDGTIEGIGEENMVTIIQASIIDDDPASASTLSPVKNTLLEESQKTPSQDNGSSGGSFAWLNIFAFGLIAFRKKFT